MPDITRSALEQMRAGVDAAHEAAERLMQDAEAQAAARAARADAASRAQTGGIPPAGWAVPPPPEPDDDSAELKALMRLLDVARDLVRSSVPPELATQLAQALRELLLAVRAVIDWYIDRLDRPEYRAAEREVEDIPIV